MRSSSARRCGGCGRTSRSAPTSSRAFRPRPKRCSRARRIWSRNAISPSCTCFPIRRARARRPRGCRRSRASAIKERAKRLRAAGEAALQKRLAAEIGATRQVLIESATQGRTEHFLPVAIAGETPGAVRALDDHRARWRAADGVSRKSAVVARLDRAIQYAAASRLITDFSGILDHPLSRMMTAVVGASVRSLPVPPARPEPLPHMLRRRRHHAHRLLVLRNRNHDLAGMQMQDRLAEARAVAVDVVADDRPARR